MKHFKKLGLRNERTNERAREKKGGNQRSGVEIEFRLQTFRREEEERKRREREWEILLNNNDRIFREIFVKGNKRGISMILEIKF